MRLLRIIKSLIFVLIVAKKLERQTSAQIVVRNYRLCLGDVENNTFLIRNSRYHFV